MTNTEQYLVTDVMWYSVCVVAFVVMFASILTNMATNHDWANQAVKAGVAYYESDSKTGVNYVVFTSTNGTPWKVQR